MQSLKLFIFSFVLLLSCGNATQTKEAKEVAVNMQQIDTLRFVEHTDNKFLSVFLDFEYTEKVDVFDKPNGKIIQSVQNDDEDIVLFDLLQKNDSMFYVVAYSGLDNQILAEGWIYKDNHLGVYSAAYGERQCSLYKFPLNKEKIIITETEYNPDMYKVLDFEGNWLKVKINIKGKTYQGWLPPEMQCANPYTTCS